MKKIILAVIICFSFIGCAGPFWAGPSRTVANDATDITISIKNPFYAVIQHIEGDHSLCEKELPECTEY